MQSVWAVPDAVTRAAEATYDERLGPARTACTMRSAIPALDARLLLVHSVDDERMPVADSEDVASKSANVELLTVEGMTRRRTARDPEAVARIADFLAH